MADVTFEKVLDVVRLLPAEEPRRLRKWLAEEEQKRASQTDNSVSQPARREREMRWLREHEAQFAGQWLALEGERLLSHGTDARKVYEEGRALAVNVPFMAYAESPDEAWMGGW